MEHNPNKKFDIRTLEYSFSKGLLTPKEYEKFLNELPDEEGNYDFIEIKDDEDEYYE